jgi:hypothetical protein
MSQYMGERLPIFFGAVLALSFLLLMMVFRSLLVPLKAVVMNVVSIAAAYGVDHRPPGRHIDANDHARIARMKPGQRGVEAR